MAAIGGEVAGVATILASVATALVTFLLGRRSQVQKEAQGAYGQLWQLYQDRRQEIADLKLELAADRKECQDEIAELRRRHDTEIADIRRECEERVAVEARRAHGEVAELERRLEQRVDNYRRDRDYWRAKAEGRLNGGKDKDDTPPPEHKR